MALQKNKFGQKRGQAKTILGKKSGPAIAGPAGPQTTALTCRMSTSSHAK